jgi:hypothetical protein
MPPKPHIVEALPPEFDQGNCRELGMDALNIMYPTDGDKVGEAIAKKVCEGCVVIEPCRERGKKEPEGVWGGLAPRDRRSMKREKAKFRNLHGNSQPR